VLALAALAACGGVGQAPDDHSSTGGSQGDGGQPSTGGQSTGGADEPGEDDPPETTEALLCREEWYTAGSLERVYTHAYDEEGRLVADGYQQVAIDDEPLIQTTYEYDAADNQVGISSLGSSGAVQAETTNTFDEDGNLLTVAVDQDLDGTADHGVDRTYDEQGNLLTEQGWGAGDSANWSATYTYDADGHLLTDVQDGTVHEYTYDERGLLVAKSARPSSEAEVSELITYSYDEEGRLVEQTYDDEPDDAPELVTTYAYDDSGHQVAIESRYVDPLQADMLITQTFDEEGNLLTGETDVDIDGTVEYSRVYLYECDP